MSRTHGRADIYLDGTIAWTQGIVTEQQGARLQVKARNPEHPSAWITVLTLTEVAYVGKSGRSQRWTGVNPDGDTVELTTVPRVSGCRSCGG